MEWELIKFFAGYFWKGLWIGVIIRIIIAIVFRHEVSWGGLIRSALFGGFVYLVMILLRYYSI